jgi:dTDP-4-dehydrorhamnose reductase
LLLSYIPAVCAFVAPCQPGASAAIIDRLSPSQALSVLRSDLLYTGRMRVLIIGKGGQLGSELLRAEWPSGLEAHGLSEAELDITQAAAVETALEGAELVINAAAYTAVDKAESERDRAYAVNRDGPANLAYSCARSGAPLFHISTDYVFDGSKPSPYLEDDATEPLGVYGASKAAGEVAVRSSCREHMIVRTSWVVSAFGHNFVKTMLRLAAERDRLRVVADQFGRPTPAKALAAVLVRIAQRYAEGSPPPRGTYHFAAAGRTSWHGLAQAVVELQAPITGRNPPVDPITTADFPTPAKRPQNSELATDKLEKALGLTIAPWRAGVADIVEELLRQP